MSNPRSWTMTLPWYVFCAAVVIYSPARTTASSPSTTQSSAARSDHNSSTNALCNADKSVCVAPATQNMLMANPFDIAVTATSIVSDINWELDDQTGQKLVSGKASDDPNTSFGGNTTSPPAFHMRDFIFVLPKSPSGALKLLPVRIDKQGKSSGLPEVNIAVRFGSATSTLTLVVPEDYHQYQDEAAEWVGNGPPPSHFTSPFIKHTLTILHVNDSVFASAEAAAEKASPLSQAPIRILHFAVRGSVAYVDLNLNHEGYGWAGISFTIASVEPLIEKDLSQFPYIHKVVFAWPPGNGLHGKAHQNCSTGSDFRI
jgi:hypothetical protein